MLSLEHFVNWNHKLSSYKSGLGQGYSGLRQAQAPSLSRGYKENLVNRVNPVKKVPRPVVAKFTAIKENRQYVNYYRLKPIV